MDRLIKKRVPRCCGRWAKK